MIFSLLVYWTAAEILARLAYRIAPYALITWAILGAPLWACFLAALVVLRRGWRVRNQYR